MYKFKKINTRGRKREAKRWIEETNRHTSRIVFGDGPPRAGVDSQGRTFTERSQAGALAWVEISEQMKARDPVLHEAVMEILWAGIEKTAAMTPEQFRARRIRRMDKYCREQRAQRKAQSPR
jgi:hypothetical protein